MSIIESLKRLADPIRFREEKAEHEEHLVMPAEQESGAPIQYQCSVCDLISEKGDYCPECLAPTMCIVPPEKS